MVMMFLLLVELLMIMILTMVKMILLRKNIISYILNIVENIVGQSFKEKLEKAFLRLSRATVTLFENEIKSPNINYHSGMAALMALAYKYTGEDAFLQLANKYEATVRAQFNENGLLVGEAACTNDLINITSVDFATVNLISIIAIFVIIMIVEKSISLPVILVAVIELAIFINLGLPHYIGESLPFIAPICISTIQLGATVDYAILMTTRYKRERQLGNDKRTAVTTALETSIPSIVVSAMGLFAATVGVALYSNVQMIGSLCALMARGAIISMFCVILILPAMFMLLDRVIGATTIGFRAKKSK